MGAAAGKLGWLPTPPQGQPGVLHFPSGEARWDQPYLGCCRNLHGAAGGPRSPQLGSTCSVYGECSLGVSAFPVRRKIPTSWL